jgi:hypothetical protein
MKKSIMIVAAGLCLLALVPSGFAQMDQVVLSSSQITTNVGTASAIVKGEIYSIRMDTTANKTNGIAIKTAEGETVLAVSALTADATYFPLVPASKAADGAAATFVGGTNDTANAVYLRQGVSSLLTMTVTPAANTTGTNTMRAIITFKK